MNLQQSKERILGTLDGQTKNLFLNAQFLNTVAQVYGRLFDFPKGFCGVWKFDKCPYLSRRQDLLRMGSSASIFVTILHKATMSAMLDKHPIDSGLLDEEYDDVYGIDLTNFRNLEESLQDGRFEKLYEAVLKRAKQLTGVPWYSPKELLESKQEHRTGLTL